MLAFLHTLDRRYQIAFDEHGVYIRNTGFRFETRLINRGLDNDHGARSGVLGWFGAPPVGFMAYGSMGEISSDHSNPEFRHSGRYVPDAAIYILGQMDPPGLYDDTIGVDFDSFKRTSICALKEMLCRKRPDLAPPQWTTVTVH